MVAKGLKPTHWLMSEQTWQRIIYDDLAVTVQDYDVNGRRKEEYLGLPVFFERGICDGALVLSDASFADRLRETEIREQISIIQCEAMRDMQPLQEELRRIYERRHPVHVVDIKGGAIFNLSERPSEQASERDPEMEGK